MHLVGILLSARLYIPSSTVFGGLVSHVISPLSFMGIIFTSSRRILLLLLLVYCSQLITKLSPSLYGLWTSLLTCLFMEPSIVSLLVWMN